MDHPQVAHSLINLATVYLDLNRHELAKQSLEQALPVLEKNLGADHLMVVDCKTKLAMTLMLLDEAVEAEGLLQEVLVACKNSNAKPAVIANCHFRLGVALAKQAKYEAAESHLNQAVEAQDQILGPNNAATVRSKNALATLYRQTGRIELAERLASQVKAISHESSDNSFER
jgi:tetratricopeptide (TPR) repeat protein